MLMDNIEVRFSFGEEYRVAKLINYNESFDLAILKIESCNFCKRIDFEINYDTGEEVYSIGNTSNQGISISTDAFFSDGNSGGALLNTSGKCIGITTLRLKDKTGSIIYGIGYAIPSNIILDYINSNNIND